MKKSFYLLNLFLCLFVFASCKFELDNIVRDKQIEYISVDALGDARLSYNVDDKFCNTDVKVYAYYSDTSYEEINPALLEFSGFDSSKAGTTITISVKYKDFETSYDVNILESKVIEIQVTQKPKVLCYKPSKNEKVEFNPEGLEVTAYRSDNTKVILSSEQYSITGFDLTDIGLNNSVKIEYIEDGKKTGIFCNLEYYVVSNEIKELKISSYPRQTVYLNTQKNLNLDGLSVSYITENDNIEKSISLNYVSINPADLSDLCVGEHTIVISLNDKAVNSFKIRITDKYVEDFKVNVKDINSHFFEGDNIKLTEAFEFYKIYGKDSNDKIVEERITENYDTVDSALSHLKYSYKKDIGFDEANEVFSESGESYNLKLVNYGLQKIYFYYKIYDYENQSSQILKKEINISVNTSYVNSINAVWKNGKSYPLGVTPDSSNPNEYGEWEITANLSDGNSNTKIDSQYCSFKYKRELEDIYGEFLRGNKDTVQSKVLVSYITRNKAGKVVAFSAEEDVYVSKPLITSVKILSYPKTNYYSGEELNLNGLEIEVFDSYNTKGMKYNYNELIENKLLNFTFDENKILKKSDKEIVMTIKMYNEVNIKFPVSVVDYAIKGIRITPKNEYNNNSLIFNINQRYDFMNFFNVKFINSNGNEIDIPDTNNIKFSTSYNLSDGNTISDGYIYVFYDTGEVKYYDFYSVKFTNGN